MFLHYIAFVDRSIVGRDDARYRVLQVRYPIKNITIALRSAEPKRRRGNAASN